MLLSEVVPLPQLSLSQHRKLKRGCRAACTPDGSGITYADSINVAIAVAMPDGGLITPVLKSADQTDIYQLSRNWVRNLDRASMTRQATVM